MYKVIYVLFTITLNDDIDDRDEEEEDSPHNNQEGFERIHDGRAYDARAFDARAFDARAFGVFCGVIWSIVGGRSYSSYCTLS